MQKSKTAAIAICVILAVSMLGAITLTSAHTPSWQIPTFPHIYLAENPIGVGQKESIYLFVTPTYADTQILNDYRFRNWTLQIVAPNGALTEMKFPYISDTTSNQGTSFTPDQVGTYNLTFIVPNQAVNDYSHAPGSQYENDTYIGGTVTAQLVVQQDPIAVYPYPGLPTEYWTRPIFGENVMWYKISSNWLGSGAPGYGGSTGPNTRVFSGDSMGSLTSHVMWTRELTQPGGVAGGNNLEIPGNTWFEGTAYSQRFVNPIIVAGRLYYQEPLFSVGTGTRGTAGPTVCVDLFTGQEIWRRSDVPALSFAYVQDMENPDYHGVRPAVLATTNFAQVYDAATGTNVFNVSNVPAPTNPDRSSLFATVVGPNGEQIRYIMVNNGTSANPAWQLCQWNSSRFWGQGSMQELNLQTVTQQGNYSKTEYVNGVATTTLTPYTQTFINASRGIMYDSINTVTPADQNVSISWRNNMPGNPAILGAYFGDIMLCRNGSYPSSLAPSGNQPYNYFAVNLNKSKGEIGSILWTTTVPPAIDAQFGNITTVSFAGMSGDYFCESYRQTSQIAFFNLRTGAFIKLSAPTGGLDYYGSTGSGALHNVVAFGRCYAGAMSGILTCFDMSTGDIVWTFGNGGKGNTTDSGMEYPGHFPIFVKAIGGRSLNEGVVYTIYTEHTLTTPIAKGARTFAINATDGTQIYEFTDATGEFGAGSFAIADGMSVFFNSYDSRIYNLGRGPSQTTIQVGPKSQALGGNVVIEGTVNDVSVGLQTTEIQGRFPAGVPACSDDSMCDWMAYVHQQQPKPTNFTGVNVHLYVLDGNGNYQDLGVTTTDMKGQYSMTWTPNIEGDFKVTAYFEGTNGYWPSNAQTTFNVAPAGATAVPPATQPPSTADQYFLPMSIATILAVVVIGVLLAMMVRKRP